jgi:small nuclear ribonucleoprotein (snRNP)-like protein
MNMLVNRYFGDNVVVTLDTGEKHQGILEDVIDPENIGYVKVRDGDEVVFIPEDQIENIRPALLN